jgi:dGTPase
MEWEALLCQERYTDGVPDGGLENKAISAFQLDCERIIYTSVFRRLQGKTQVYPLPLYDYLRTRLTHTNEVAFVGRVLGKKVAARLKDTANNYGISAHQADSIEDIIHAACLTHDLGNPPFGHIGEEAIQSWFEKHLGKKEGVVNFEKILRDNEKKYDFLSFEGNAQSFRIVTRLSTFRNSGGMRLTFASIAAGMKYPWSSSDRPEGKKKFGFHYADRRAAEQVFNKCGMRDVSGKATRHPLAYLVEAADDISYLTTDIDDAHRMKQIETSAAIELLKPIGDLLNLNQNFNSVSGAGKQDKVSFLRSTAASAMIEATVKSFFDNYDKIMAGTFGSNNILDSTAASEKITEIRNFCRKYVYTEHNKIQTEAAGFHVISSLLNIFSEMRIELSLNARNPDRMDKKNQNLLNLLPKESQDALLKADEYESLVVLTDYISGMTDKFALELYQRLSANSVSLGRML